MVLEALAGLATYGYVGVFVMSLVGSATIIFPVPYFIVIFGLATTLNPVLLAVAAGVGSAIGEFTGFYLGHYSKKMLKSQKKWLSLTEKWFKRNGFLTLVFLAAAPLPTDIGGIVAGMANYGRWKFLCAMLIGKMVKFAVVVYAGYYSLSSIMQYIGW